MRELRTFDIVSLDNFVAVKENGICEINSNHSVNIFDFIDVIKLGV